MKVPEKITSHLHDEFDDARRKMDSWLDTAETRLKHCSPREGGLDDFRERHQAVKVRFTALLVFFFWF